MPLSSSFNLYGCTDCYELFGTFSCVYRCSPNECCVEGVCVTYDPVTPPCNIVCLNCTRGIMSTEGVLSCIDICAPTENCCSGSCCPADKYCVGGSCVSDPDFGQNYFSKTQSNISSSDLFNLLNSYGIEYIVVGGFSKYLRGETHSYNDIDLIYNNEIENITKLISVLSLVTGEREEEYSYMKTETPIVTSIFLNDNKNVDFGNIMGNMNFEQLKTNSTIIHYFDSDINVASNEDSETLRLSFRKTL